MENELEITQNESTNVGAETESKKSFQEMLDTDKEYRRAFDKAITKATETAINNAKSEWVKQYEAERTEAEKLAKMNADEKLQYELERTKNELEQTKTEKDGLNNYINSLELKNTASSYASEQNLPFEYIKDWDFTKESAESVKTKIDNLVQIRTKDLESYVNTQLRQSSPKVVENTITEEDAFIRGFKSYGKNK